jgi:general secretion pathway protein K
MKRRVSPDCAGSRRGFALIIVMTVIFVLAILAGGFAYSMKVESRLAAHAHNESELEWMGRSGVELAKYVLDQSARLGARYTSLNQIWAGGPGDGPETNSPLAGINLRAWPLGEGMISVEIVDLERKLNLNRIASMLPAQGGGQDLLARALALMGVDAAEAATIVDSILDWRDPDDASRLSGAESDFYLSLDPPYYAKNGAIDDLAELLLVHGVTPEIYWGPRAAAHRFQWADTARGRRPRGRASGLAPSYPFGLVDLFTPLSSGAVNINTAPLPVLQVALGISDDLAANIIRARAGLDGVEGTEDDTPFLSANLAAVPGLEALPPELRAPLTTVSSHFEVTVNVHLGRSHRQCRAILARNVPGIAALAGEGGVRVLQFSWK